jgi:hypothetical protein
VPHTVRSLTEQPPSIRVAPEPSLAMALLATGVPLSLLMDLADPLGPDSLGIMANESDEPRLRVVDLRDKSEVAS